MSNTDGDPAIKTPATSKVASILKDLHERAKELNCLYQIEELASDPERSLEEVLAGTLNAIPPGWQYPDVCRVRIVCDGRVYQSSDFRQSAWVQRAPICVQGESVGAVEVYYIEELPLVDEGPFLKEERRLIGIIAERLASCVTHHKLVEAMAAWKATERNITKHTMRDWSVILDLLRRTDQACCCGWRGRWSITCAGVV
jgi:pyruvate,water dikinase